MRCRSSASVTALATIGRAAKQPAVNALSHRYPSLLLSDRQSSNWMARRFDSLLGTLILMG